MRLVQDIRYSARSLWASRGRTALTALGVVIGVMAVVSVGSIGKSAQNLVVDQVASFGTNLVLITPGRSDENGPPPIAFGVTVASLKLGDYDEMRRLPGAVSGSPFVQTAAAVSFGNRSTAVSIRGTGAELPALEDFRMAEGRFFSERDVASYSRMAVLGKKTAERLFPHSDPVGQQVRIKGHGFTVVGVMAEQGFSMFQNQDDQVIVPITAAQKVLMGIEHVNGIRIKVGDSGDIPEFIGRAERLLRQRHGIADPSKDDFSVNSANQYIETLNSVTGAINAFLVLVTAVALLVGGINIMNIMFVSVRERTREIGLRKALGARPSVIAGQFLGESVLIAVFGGAVGVVLGALLALLAWAVINGLGLEWDFVLPLPSVAAALGVAVGIGLVFGYVPARQAAGLDPIESLRYE